MTSKPIRCDGEHCGRPAMCSVELRLFCVDHFILHCYERLNQCRPIPFCDPDDEATESNERFLRQCADQAANLLRPMRGLDNLERARLFDILLWTAELTTTPRAFKASAMSQR